MTWSSGQMWTPRHEPEELPEVVLSPYMAAQLADLEPLRDEDGDVPYSADE
jgi:hypothetical protein